MTLHKSLLAVMAILLLLGCESSPSIQLDDDVQDFEDAIQAAQQAANGNSFSLAFQKLEEAQKLGIGQNEVQELRTSITQQQAAYEERKRKDRELAKQRERQHRQAEEQKRFARQRQNSGGGSTSGFVQITADYAVPLCYVETLTLSGGSGRFSANGSGSMVGILKAYNGSVAGRYSYTVKTSCNKYCSGSFGVSGQKGNVFLNLSSNCDPSVSEH